MRGKGKVRGQRKKSVSEQDDNNPWFLDYLPVLGYNFHYYEKYGTYYKKVDPRLGETAEDR